ncbi:MAG: SpoIIIAH-like family protein [Lachnospiraceae bacterium]|nr:SpoIIIAH-like family protein [Lachnospiraceae bacterium]MDD3615163.1 SpoIIIAH-like family protein [Lachnospiraceae bacterium]
MKKILKKNQIIITVLALLIGVAGYLNYTDFDFGKKVEDALSAQSDEESQESALAEDSLLENTSEDIDSLDYDITQENAVSGDESVQETSENSENSTGEADLDTPGEAVLTGASAYAAQAKLSREQVRSTNREALQGIINNSELTEEERQDAVASMVQLSDLSEREAAAELLLEAKGFENAVVSLTGDSADVVISQADIDDEKLAQIEEIVKRKTQTAPENIVITPVVTEK